MNNTVFKIDCGLFIRVLAFVNKTNNRVNMSKNCQTFSERRLLIVKKTFFFIYVRDFSVFEQLKSFSIIIPFRGKIK